MKLRRFANGVCRCLPSDYRMKLVTLGGAIAAGKATQVDDEDLEMLEGLAWTMHRNGYIRSKLAIGERRRDLLLHRLILGIEDDPNLHVDHLDEDKLNNQKSNLLIGLKSSPNFRRMQAMRQKSEGESSKHRGVSYHKQSKKFRARMKCTDGCRHSLGYFDSEEDASKVYEEVLALELKRLEKIVRAETAEYFANKSN